MDNSSRTDDRWGITQWWYGPPDSETESTATTGAVSEGQAPGTWSTAWTATKIGLNWFWTNTPGWSSGTTPQNVEQPSSDPPPPRQPTANVPSIEPRTWTETWEETVKWVRPEGDARKRATNLNAKIAEYVKSIFRFVKQEYSRSVDLNEVVQAGKVFLVTINNALSGILPLFKIPVPKMPDHPEKEAEPLPFFVATPPSTGLSSEARHWSNRVREILFATASATTPDVNKFCELLGTMVAIGMKKMMEKKAVVKGLEKHPSSAKLVEDEAEKNLEILAARMTARNFATFKSSIIKRLDAYLSVSLPILTQNSAPNALKQALAASEFQLLYGAFSEETTEPKKKLTVYLDASLAAHLKAYLSGHSWAAALSVAGSEGLAKIICDLTCKAGVDQMLVSLLDSLMSSETSDSTPTAKAFATDEEDSVVSIVKTVVTHLFKDQKAADLLAKKGSVVGPTQFNVVSPLNSALGKMIAANVNEAYPRFELINPALERQVENLESSKPSEPIPQSKIQKYFGEKDPKPTGSLNFIVPVVGYQGFKDLRAILHKNPWWAQNLLCLVVEQALDSFLPVAK